MEKNLGSAALLAGTAIIFTAATPSIGQDLFSGGGLSLEVNSTLRVNDNLGLDDPSPGISTLWDNRFTLGFVSETPVSEFTFDIGGTVRGAALPGLPLSATFDDPFAVLGYRFEGANSRFEADASYRKIDLSSINPLSLIEDDELGETDLIVDDGSRATTAAWVLFESGLNDPFGFGVEVEHKGVQYSGTADPGLFDSRTNSASVFTRYRFSSVAEGRLTASWEKYDADDVTLTSRETFDLTAGLVYEFDPITTLEASLGYAYITETTNLPSTAVQRGLSGSVELTRAMPNGSAGLVFESDLTANGRRSELTASRALELPTGALEASLGVSLGPSGTFIPIGSLDYVYELPRGEITASLNRRAATNTAGNDVVTMGASFGYSTDINRLSSLSFDADFASVADFGFAPVDRTTLTSLRVTYSYELAPDWDLSAGYEHRIRTETGVTRRASNEVYLMLDYKFDARP